MRPLESGPYAGAEAHGAGTSPKGPPRDITGLWRPRWGERPMMGGGASLCQGGRRILRPVGRELIPEEDRPPETLTSGGRKWLPRESRWRIRRQPPSVCVVALPPLAVGATFAVGRNYTCPSSQIRFPGYLVLR